MNRVEPVSSSPPNCIIEFADFIPKVTDRVPLEGRTKYEKFRAVVDRANKWLSRRPHSRVISLESVQVSPGNPIPHCLKITGKTEDQNILRYAVQDQLHPVTYLRGFRVWVVNNKNREPNSGIQVIKYFSVVPAVRLVASSKRDRCKYITSTLPDLFREANEYISSHDIRGQLVAAETIPVIVSSDRISPEMCAWTVDANLQEYVEALRIFYLRGEIRRISASVDYIDFLPEKMLPTGDYATYCTNEFLQQQMKDWMVNNPRNRVLKINTYPRYSESFDGICPTTIDQVLQKINSGRIFFYKPDIDEPQPQQSAVRLETFIPKIALSTSFWPCGQRITHESQSEISERIAEWSLSTAYQDPHCQVFMAETFLLNIPTKILISPSGLLSWLWPHRKRKVHYVVLKCCRLYASSQLQ